ncbi:MAG: hypothetical protein V7K32_17720 [Nostoc sp.]
MFNYAYLLTKQVFDVLSYYSDHQDEINAYIECDRYAGKKFVIY